MEEFEIKRAAALQLLQEAGINEAVYSPPLLRALWRFGFKVPPPHFAKFLPTAAVSGALFALGWGLIMWLLQWSSTGLPPTLAVGASLAAGALFGISMGVYYAHDRKKHRLPAWSSLGSGPGA